ncbi:ABC-type branched-subunit amino acid transport system substrate-binding protein [Isoptericola sp. CG 20/1183]|uniref:ABC-type branched-subunit amino acid transport system substrate-binding protein n=1 Tax=Isoptericola halotolerans TaxID=300560 RepID=A0ABX5EE86_9MICO|nr:MULTISPECIES: substrate-binding domain-containing protein [Isoptericola]MCK0117932.1 substrate-binding domain-containing protein [Isoptericola sp. S6320L]PRZ07013.1 ABC-type branched-subunit amino acid transport system substrate-binding protein [Isoptericola halotolerans]PRZ07315.1 ABC-type branched-subunit amino acid transport system substrate-binding protein [Isoptericola sp. CG 20/1183]
MSDFVVGVLLHFQGPGGIYGPSCQAVTELAVAEINATGGVLGRPVRAELFDAGQPPPVLRRELGAALDAGRLDALTGWHTSAVRNAVVPVVQQRVPYVYPAAYEGAERRSGLYVTGEVPSAQLFPAIRRLRATRGVRRWYVVGDDYAWPRGTFRVLTRQIAGLDAQFAGARFLPAAGASAPVLAATLDAVEAARADGVLLLMVGQNGVRFNRAFARRGLHERMLRLSTLMEENMLLGSGAGATTDLYSAGGWFRSLATGEALDLIGRYTAHHGLHAPAVGAAAEACYEGIFALRSIVQRAGSPAVAATDRSVDGLVYEGPRGPMQFSGNHAAQRLYLARADGVDFELLTEL